MLRKTSIAAITPHSYRRQHRGDRPQRTPQPCSKPIRCSIQPPYLRFFTGFIIGYRQASTGKRRDDQTAVRLHLGKKLAHKQSELLGRRTIENARQCIRPHKSSKKQNGHQDHNKERTRHRSPSTASRALTIKLQLLGIRFLSDRIRLLRYSLAPLAPKSSN